MQAILTNAQAHAALAARANAMYARHGFAPRAKGQRYPAQVFSIAHSLSVGVQQQLRANIVASSYGVFSTGMGIVVGQYLVVRWQGKLVPCYRLRVNGKGGAYCVICQHNSMVAVK